MKEINTKYTPQAGKNLEGGAVNGIPTRQGGASQPPPQQNRPANPGQGGSGQK